MCGRFTLLLSWHEVFGLLNRFIENLKPESIPQIKNAPARYNIAPTQPILSLHRSGGGVEPALMRWGLVPEWVENPNDFPLIINARAQTLNEKTSFKHALKNRRCIIPASGYYEWQKQGDGQKVPTYITRRDGLPFLFAGLFSTWVGAQGEEVDTAAIITVGATSSLCAIHSRTPAVLEPQAAASWLDTSNVNSQKALELLRPMPEGLASYFAVSRRVNSPRNDDEGLIAPADEHGERYGPIRSGPAQLDLF